MIAQHAENKPSELAKRIAAGIKARIHVSDPFGDLSAVIASHIAPLEAALAASQAECERLKAPVSCEWKIHKRPSGDYGQYFAFFVERDDGYQLAECDDEEDARLVVKAIADNAALRQQVETLRGALFMAKGYITEASPCPEENMVLVDINAALSAQPAAQPSDK